jgi:hypothetical protein
LSAQAEAESFNRLTAIRLPHTKQLRHYEAN